VDNCSRYCQSPATLGYSERLGRAAIPDPFPIWKKADLVLIVGSNTAESHPVIATRVNASKLHDKS